MSLTSDLTSLIRTKSIGDDDLEAAALFVLDALACAFGARRSPQGRILLDWFVSDAEARREAFLFGSLVHVLEMDDLHRESVTHPGCVVIPAAWSAAARERIGGREFLAAVLRGYEAVCRVGDAVGPSHYEIWHNTATCGPFGAAFAVASLLQLDDEQTVWALGNAGTQASGLWQFLEEGAMSKHLHAGRAAESGQIAADLAARGFTGPALILEGRKGFFAAACPDAIPGRVASSPVSPWQLRQTSIKPWPSCRHTHPAVDAALELHGRVQSEDLKAIRVETYQAALDLCDNQKPSSEYEAKFSLHHCAAAAFTDGELGLDSFNAAARERLSKLMAKTTVRASDEFNAAYPSRWGARLTLETAGGERLIAERPICKGDPELPVTPDEMRAKAAMLLSHAGLAEARAEALIDGVLSLPKGRSLPSLDDLFAAP